jgi:hypothetical protein
MDAEEFAIRRRLKDDLTYYAPRCLKIRTKSGAITPLQLNAAQQYVHERLEAQLKATGKVRALILKARQQGFSTYIGGRFYHRVTHGTGLQCFILTHEQEATNNLFGMVDRYHQNNNPLVKPSTGAANAKELYFDRLDSGYGVGTAGAKAVGRSKTVQLFHGSEVAFWPNAPTHFAGVVQAIPDLPGTEIILESTANGVGGEFHERWQQAEAGIGDYIAIFVPWFWSDEYRRPVPEGFSLSDDEDDYARLHSLDLGQMVWRRAKLAELKDPLLFKQEYPATAAEAFQTTGHDAFITKNDANVILEARKASREPFGSLVVGVDPAGQGNDSTAIAWRRGGKVLKVERRHKLKSTEKANWVKQIIDDDAPAKVFIDVGGGYGEFIDILRDWGEPYAKTCEPVNFGGAPQTPPKIGSDGEIIPGPKNRRSEMWLRMREWLEDEAGADIPDDDALHADLSAPGSHNDLRQFLVLESKKDIIGRGLRSPDGADAVALTFASPVKAQSEAVKPARYNKSRRGRSAWAA